jgi:hypothetical protein
MEENLSAKPLELKKPLAFIDFNCLYISVAFRVSFKVLLEYCFVKLSLKVSRRGEADYLCLSCKR